MTTALSPDSLTDRFSPAPRVAAVEREAHLQALLQIAPRLSFQQLADLASLVNASRRRAVSRR